MSELDVIGTIHGTDKSSVHSYAWDYLRHYEKLFARWKSEPINLIEIGVFGGSSLDTWLDYFDKATLVGIDINPGCKKFERDRVHVRIGSQEDPAFLQSVTAEFKPTIIIDDGSHEAHHMIASFEALFPALAPGGVYIFEDLSFHFEDGVGQWRGPATHQGLSDLSIYDYLAPFFRGRLANLKTPAKSWGFSRYVHENVDSVVAFGGALAITKREPTPIEERIAIFQKKLAESVDRPKVQRRFVEFLLKNNARIDLAKEHIDELIAGNPTDPGLMDHMFSISGRLGRHDLALEWGQKVADQRPQERSSWVRLANVQGALNKQADERKSLERAIQIDPRWTEGYWRISQIAERTGDLDAALKSAKEAYALEPKDEIARHIQTLEVKAT